MPFAKIHPSHLITVVSETVLAGPSLLSSRWKGLSRQTLPLMMTIKRRLIHTEIKELFLRQSRDRVRLEKQIQTAPALRNVFT